MTTNNCLDYIGGVKYIPTIIQCHPSGYGGGFLCKASGWPNGIQAARACQEDISPGRMPFERIHGLWRDDHHFTKKQISPACKQAEKVALLAEDFPKTDFWYSPWLEHDADLKLFRQCAKECKTVLPKRVKIVSCGLVRPRGIDEVHHSSPVKGKYIFSFDGMNMFDQDVSDWMDMHWRAKYFFGWWPQLNGRKHIYDTTPRQDRTHWPTPKQFNKAKKLMGY